MSLIRILLRSDWRAVLKGMFPRISDAKLDGFAALVAADRAVDDDGAPTEAMLAWCEAVTQPGFFGEVQP